MKFIRHLFAGAMLALSACALPAHAAWPERPITMIVPFPPGGSTDILARVLADHLSRRLGQPVVVENRGGASGNIGTAAVAAAAPDGYTLLVNAASVHTVNPSLFANMAFDGIEDFTPIAHLANVLNTMVVHPSVPAQNLQELVDYARANPGKLAYASAGAGTTSHLGAVMFERAAGIEMLHVPYKSTPQALMELVAGQTQLYIGAATQSLPHVKAGKLKLLAITEGEPSALLPDTPTANETVPGYQISVVYGALGPAGLPLELTNRLNAEINEILFLPEVREQMAGLGVQVVRSSAEDFAKTLRDDAARYSKLIEELRISASD